MGKDLRIRLEQRTPSGRLPRLRDYKAFDADTGEEIMNILRLEFCADASESVPTTTLVLAAAVELDGVEVVANVEEREPELTKEERSARAYEKSGGLVGTPRQKQ